MTDQSPHTHHLSPRAKVTVLHALGQALCTCYNHTSKLLNNKIHCIGERTKAPRGNDVPRTTESIGAIRYFEDSPIKGQLTKVWLGLRQSSGMANSRQGTTSVTTPRPEEGTEGRGLKVNPEHRSCVKRARAETFGQGWRINTQQALSSQPLIACPPPCHLSAGQEVTVGNK